MKSNRHHRARGRGHRHRCCRYRAGAQVVLSAEIAAICMDRERLRVLAHEELGLPTTPYRFAGSLEELRAGASEVGYPCVVKLVMSLSGHGQSVVRSADAIDAA